MTSWPVIGVCLVLTLGLAVWVLRAPIGARRFGGSALASSFAIMCLGLYWMPPLAALVALGRAKEAAASPNLSLDCSRAKQALALVSDTSGGMISISTEGEVKLSSEVWVALTKGERASLLSIADQSGRCLGGSGAIRGGRALDKDTGQPFPTAAG